jgi:hypothetical protein
LLRLSSDGAVLHLDDALSDVFVGTGGVVKLDAVIDGWDVGRMDERYESICGDLKTLALSNVVHGLASAQMSGVLALPAGKRHCLKVRVFSSCIKEGRMPFVDSHFEKLLKPTQQLYNLTPIRSSVKLLAPYKKCG